MSGQRYVQRQDGFFIDKISVDTYQGTQGATQIVALNSGGYVDDSLLGNNHGYITTLNGLTGAVITSGGLSTFVNASGQIVLVGASGGGSSVSDTATRPCSAVLGKPAAGQYVMIYTAETSETFPANFTSPQSYGSCGTNPTATAVYSVFKNATNVGTISVAIGGAFTFATTGGVAFSLNAGDRLTIVAPGSQDATMADVSITLVGTRSAIPAGVAPPVLTWRGAYNGSTAYSPFDLVSYLGSSYVCIVVSTGNLPTNTSFWNIVAQAGASGTTFGVQTVNSLTGNVTISGGQNVSVTQVGQTVLISASGTGGGGGSTFPWTVVQEDQYANPAAGTSITVTFPQATAASGNTAIILISFGGNVTPTFPAGWTVAFNIVGGADARLALVYKTTASDTSATFASSGSDGYSVLFWEILGIHALDALATGAVTGTFSGTLKMPAITVSANSVVFCAISTLVSSASFTPSALPTISPNWRPIAVDPGNFNGSRVLTGHISTIAATAGSITPPVINMPKASAFFSGGGTAYASFSIL